MKLVNILLLCILIFGLASCGSKGTTAAKKDVAAKVMPADTGKTMKCTGACCDSTKMKDGWMIIFDGKTTKGWRGYDKPAFPDKGWDVVDSCLHVIGSGNGEAGNGGDVIYDKKLSNFELSLDWKISKGGNSGVFILAQEIPNEPIWKSSPEMQLLDNENHPDARLGKDGNRKAGSLYDLIPAVPQNTKPFGQWNHVNIMVYQGTVVYSQNGANVVEYHLWTEDWKKMIANSKFKDYTWFLNTAKEGYIGLQDHGSDCWFKNIKLKIL